MARVEEKGEFYLIGSGDATPSRADQVITDRLVETLRLIDVRVLDHFVIGATEVVSFAETGRI